MINNSITRPKRYNQYHERVVDSLPPWRPKFEYFFEYKGVKVILTDHARVQMSKRYDFPIETQKQFFVACVDKTIGRSRSPSDPEVFIYSKRLKQGAVVKFRRDTRSTSQRICMVIITVYPRGRRKGAKSRTEVIYV